MLHRIYIYYLILDLFLIMNDFILKLMMLIKSGTLFEKPC